MTEEYNRWCAQDLDLGNTEPYQYTKSELLDFARYYHESQLNIPAIIKEYADKEIFIEIIADGYKLEGVGICWRGYVYWKQDGEWVQVDCGCLPDWIDAFNHVRSFIDEWVVYHKD